MKQNEQKGRVVSYAFTVLAVSFVLSFFVLIGYYNYLMIAPYVVPMLMALLVAMPLAFIRDAFIASIESADHSLGFTQRPLISLLCAIFIPLVSILVGVGTSTYAMTFFCSHFVPFSDLTSPLLSPVYPTNLWCFGFSVDCAEFLCCGVGLAFESRVFDNGRGDCLPLGDCTVPDVLFDQVLL